MGYCATGEGRLVIKGNIPNDIMKLTYLIFECVEDELYAMKDELYLYFDNRYFADDMRQWANTIAPYIESGKIVFCGDDNFYWQFVFNNGTWAEENGRIVYDSDPALEISEEEKQKLLDDIIKSIVTDLSTDGKPSATSFEPTADTRRRLSGVLHKWLII